MKMAKHKVIQKALKAIFDAINDLQKEVPRKEFTIDGRLVGDIGEAIAQRDYDLTLFDKLAKGHDAVTSDGEKSKSKQRSRTA